MRAYRHGSGKAVRNRPVVRHIGDRTAPYNPAMPNEMHEGPDQAKPDEPFMDGSESFMTWVVPARLSMLPRMNKQWNLGLGTTIWVATFEAIGAWIALRLDRRYKILVLRRNEWPSRWEYVAMEFADTRAAAEERRRTLLREWMPGESFASAAALAHKAMRAQARGPK